MIDKYAHIKDRIARRNIDITPADCTDIAVQYTVDTAVILGKRVSDEGIRFGYVLIILIVRNMRPVTVMTRRESQNFTKANFNVKQIVRI